MRSGKSRGQSGFSLLEVLLAIAISGIVVSAIAGAMLTLNKVTVGVAKRQKVTAAMTSFAESIKGLDYVNCGAPGNGYDYPSSPGALDAQNLGVDSIEIVSVAYWANDVGDPSGEGDFVSSDTIGCSAGGTAVLAAVDPDPASPPAATAPATVDEGAQLLTIEVKLDDIVQRTTVAKRRP